MKSNDKLKEIVFDIYKEMYLEATPSADFESLCSTGVVKQLDWFLNYYLDYNRQVEIIEKYCKKNKLDKYDRAKVMTTIMLGVSPRSIKRGTDKI